MNGLLRPWGLAQCAAARFEPARDVQMAGVLAGLPALWANGLFSGLDKHLRLPRGFYSALHIVLVLGFMALARIRRPEGLRHVPPGEFGKVIGLDRVPEVRTLREKIVVMANTGDPAAWMQELGKSWMDKGSFQNNLNIRLAGLGRAAALRIACVARHTAHFAPCIASQSSGQMSKLFPHEP